MNNHVTKYTDIEQFKQEVESSEDPNIELSNELKGAPTGCTIETLLECAVAFSDPLIITSSRSSVPIPIGAEFKIEELHEIAELIEQLGSDCITEVNEVNDGGLRVGYHFD